MSNDTPMQRVVVDRQAAADVGELRLLAIGRMWAEMERSRLPSGPADADELVDLKLGLRIKHELNSKTLPSRMRHAALS